MPGLDSVQLLLNAAEYLGGIPGIEKVPVDTRHKMVSFPDELAFIFGDQQLLQLRLCRGGYEVFTSRMEFAYRVMYDISQPDAYGVAGDDTVLDWFIFGADASDILFTSNLAHGDHFYLRFTQVDGFKSTTRIILVVMSRAPVPVQQTPGNFIA